MTSQLSIYTENKKGAAREIFGLIAKEKINVLCFVNNDSGEFGTVRVIVSDSERAKEVLQAKGYLCKLDHVVGIELDDQPGALEDFLAIVENMNMNIDYMYVGYSRESSMPIIFFHSSDLEIVAKALEKRGYKVY